MFALALFGSVCTLFAVLCPVSSVQPRYNDEDEIELIKKGEVSVECGHSHLVFAGLQ